MKKFLLASLFVSSTFNLNFAQTATGKQTDAPKIAATAAAAAKPAVRKGVEVPFVNRTLANGLEVIVLADKSVPLATVELAVRNGSFTEPPELNGLSHLYEHMFFKPNQAVLIFQCENAVKSGEMLSDFGKRFCEDKLKLKPQIGDVSYLKDSEQLGIYNGTTREEVVNYYYTTTSPYFASAMRLINDAIRYPIFDEDELAQERTVVIGEIDRNESNPGYYLSRALNEKLFYKYPTRKNALGTRETVLAATTEKMRLIQSRYYVPDNAALIVTGDVDAEEVFKRAEQIFGSWQRRAVPSFKEFPLVEHPPLPKSEGVIVEQPIQNVIVQIGWQGPSIGKDNVSTYAADVFSYILAQPDSRFQRKLVDSGLAVEAGVGYYTQRNVGPIVLTMVTTPERAKAALAAAYAEIAQFNQPDYFSAAELENAKNYLESRDLFDREKLSDYTHTLGFWWSSTGIEYYRGYYKNLRAISRADTNRYVKTYIQGKPHVGIALVSTESQKRAAITPEDLTGK